jgi:hypothetical protein
VPDKPISRYNLLRGMARGLTADLVGTPVDLATMGTNLGIAGVNYLGEKTGMLDKPIAEIDPKTVPLSSDWLVKGTPLEEVPGDEENWYGKPYSWGQMASNWRAPLKKAPKAEALGKTKSGKLIGEDLAMYHSTEGIMGLPGEYDLKQVYGPALKELTHPSFAITSNTGDYENVLNKFGSNILVPDPRALDPRTQNTTLKAHDFYTPRRDLSHERAIRRLAGAYELKPDPLELARARLRDKFTLDFPKGGSGAEAGGGLALKDPSSKTMMSSPRFQTYEHFDTHPKGAARIRASDWEATEDKIVSELRREYNRKTKDEMGNMKPMMKYDKPNRPYLERYKFVDPSQQGMEIDNVVQSHALNPDWWRSHGADPDSDYVKGVIARLRGYKKEMIDYNPSDYGELKKFGPMQINKDNFLTYITPDESLEYSLAKEILEPKGIKVYNKHELGGQKDPRVIHDFIAEEQTKALRRGR